MIFLSAQPDDFYFSWQIELQIFNFKNCGIEPGNMHILIGYDQKRGLRKSFEDIIFKNPDIKIFAYPDIRIGKKYPSSIRPNIIKQHFQAFPELENEVVFYHDSDIIFRTLPDFQKLKKGHYWFVSDTKSYINTDYIISSGSRELFLEMCHTVNITPQTVLENDANAGGAQYLLKNVTYNYWCKVEKDCEALFTILTRFNNANAEKEYESNGKKRSEHTGIQAWCADMWAVLWNALLYGYEVKIDHELDFCWPDEAIKRWHDCKILHYTGGSISAKPRSFCKVEYTQYPPYDEDLSSINNQTCSKIMVELINDYKQHQRKNRINLRDTSFLIPVSIDSDDRLENLLLVTRWLDKFFDTNIIIGECGNVGKIPQSKLPKDCQLFFFPNENKIFNHVWLNNQLIQRARTHIIAIYDTDIVLHTQQIIDSVALLRDNHADMVSPYDGTFVGVDNLFKIAFNKLTDADLFYQNCYKFHTATKRSWGGAIFTKKDLYMASGGDNEFFKSWGPEDIERVKRMENLGHRVKRVNGPLFHLPHTRKENSGYLNSVVYMNYMEEYLKICRMHKNELQTYVNNWPWKKSLTE